MAVLTRWTEYCQELYNYELKPYTSILKSKTSSVDETDDMQEMKEVKEALRTSKGGKSPGADNIPAELVKHGGPEMIMVLNTLCKKIWKTKECPKEWAQCIIFPLPKREI